MKDKRLPIYISKDAQPYIVVVFLLSAVIAYGWYEYSLQSDRNFELLGEVANLEQELKNTKQQLVDALEENENLSDELSGEKNKVSSIEDTVDEVADIVGDLQKLGKIETELLQKYSKVYFLNEHYEPKKLKNVDSKFLYFEDRPQQVDSRVYSYLDKLLEDAKDDDIELFVLSGFRSFGEQTSLKAGYTVNYGSGANTFSADQGYSEHQLGTTIDFMTTGIDGTLSGFDGTKAYEWLEDNAHKYGFVLSYPKGNAYYIYEPWHWRFVGKDLARDLRDDAIYYYDLPQKVIDTYRLELFD